MAAVTTDAEKQVAAKTSVVSTGSDSDGGAVAHQPEVNYDRAVEKSLVRKIDLIVLPCLALAYFTHTLDRANLGNAKTGNIQQDLDLAGNQFSLILIFFYVPYGLMNVPFTLLSKRLNPAVVIPTIITLWGIMAASSAASKNFGDILACRILMGTVEAAFYPSAILYMSFFYTRRELSLRVGVMGMMGYLAGAVSGLIAWSVFQWDKALRGWQYLFIIEGAITIAIGLMLYVVLPHGTETARWLSAEEKEVARVRLYEDTKEEDHGFHWEDVAKECKSWETWVYTLMPLLYGVGVTSSSNFLPTIVKRVAITTSKANLYTVGPNLVAAFLMLSFQWLSDRIQQRAYIAAGTVFYALIGWVLIATLDLVQMPRVGYFLTYLTTSGSFIAGNVVPVWTASNTTTSTGRAFRLGLSFMGQNIAGVISSSVFRDQDAPVYKPALITIACTEGMFIVLCLGLRTHFARLNKKLDRGEVVHVSHGIARPEYRYAV
ncbi:hypothetical protein LTR36_007875 [Oleoguttula mirabilis]|uniref:Major facilitator superfamily (MFS) profile domain-containing protein n=1 Tax=Oleoguttula mirabilis TaxID=1507867 RepID=A0AAV9J942_9PEZI|nr:hypothetical protein LTR36_007875 [Oleoguttula mirabilis]